MPRSLGHSILLRAAWVVGTAIAYALLDRLAASFQIEQGVSVLFPATAVAIVACMSFGVWGAIGVVLGTAAAPWANIQSIPETLMFGLINAIEGTIPAIVFRLRPALSRDLRDPRSLVAFIANGTILNTALSAALGTSLLVAAESSTPFGQRFLVWWLADFAAALLIATPILAFGGSVLRRLGSDTASGPRRPLAITNALQITAAIVLLGWFASSVVRNVVETRLEASRLAHQERANEVGRLLDRLHSNFLHAQGLQARSATEVGLDRAIRFGETAQLHRGLMAELQPLLAASTPAALDQFQRLGAKSESWFAAGRAIVQTGASAAPLDTQAITLSREFLNLRTSIENSDDLAWLEFRRMRKRLTILGFAIDAVVVLILLIAFATLISRISRPLSELHRSIEQLGHGTLPPGAGPDDAAFVEIRTLHATIGRAAAELQQRELELMQQTRVAVDASRHKSEFLAKMSHELRTPLNAILGFSELLRQSGESLDPARRARFVDNVVRSSRLLLSMINDLLDIARLESGSISFDAQPVDVRVIVRNAAGAVEALILEKQQTLTLDLPGEPAIAPLDREKLEQVLVKLLSNAIKFSDAGAEIVVRARCSEVETALEVTDRGIGIDPNDHERIFESFEQVYSTGELSQGTGLGLTLARRFVEAQGGTISVRSNDGPGATFTVRIPRGNRP